MFDTGGTAVRLIFFWGGLGFFLLLELLNSYRPNRVSKLQRWIINLGLTLFNSLLIHLIFSTSILSIILYVQEKRLGVLNAFEAPTWTKIVITIAFMDFMLYVWHLLNHLVPFLWRFHRVHHSDMNMDASTATRFHIGELAMSAIIKMALIVLLGADFLGVLIFETTVVLAVQFHHSSLRVPSRFESVFWVLFVPPSMHRIHHSVVIKERDKNYGAIFSLWDRLLGTLLREVDQEGIRIGVGAYQESGKLNFHHLLTMPFTKPVK